MNEESAWPQAPAATLGSMAAVAGVYALLYHSVAGGTGETPTHAVTLYPIYTNAEPLV